MTALLLAAALLGCRVPVRADGPTPSVDPEPDWSFVLYRVVTADGLVDYDRLEAHQDVLDAYVAWLAQARVPDSNRGRKAFWMNAYNALVLFTVLQEGRPASVKAVRPVGLWLGPAGTGFFQQKSFLVAGQRLSLGEIEHERLRGRTQDLRLHAGINCASRDCPPLRPETYLDIHIDQQLDDQMWWWVNDPARGARMDGTTPILPPLVAMFERDFVHWAAGDDPCTTLARYAEPSLRVALVDAGQRGCRYETWDYDWSLNHEARPDRVGHRDLRATHDILRPAVGVVPDGQRVTDPSHP